MISAAIASAYGLFQGSVAAAAPIAAASPLRVAALVDAGNALSASIEAERDALGSTLDADDPTGFPGAFPRRLRDIAEACLDQASLDDLRGLVGRVTFNLEQA